MEAKELRIGNRIIMQCHDATWREHEVTCYDICNIVEGKQPVKPILLTEKRLLEVGFVKDEAGQSHWYEMELDNSCMILTNDIGEDGYSKKLEFVFISNIDLEGSRCKYIHELQNLYFVLRNEELPMQ